MILIKDPNIKKGRTIFGNMSVSASRLFTPRVNVARAVFKNKVVTQS